MLNDWFPDWSGQICVVVASGQSAAKIDFEQLRGCRIIVVNNGFRLVPWADALYAADDHWWLCNRDALTFRGLRIAADGSWARQFGLHRIKVARQADHGMAAHTIRRDVLGSGCNSGFQAINLAALFGARRLILVGFDFCGEHWHGRHPDPMKSPRSHTLEKWRGYLDAVAPQLSEMGIEVVNCSEISALQNYPKMSVRAALQRFENQTR
jgi:hypothetical protein